MNDCQYLNDVPVLVNAKPYEVGKDSQCRTACISAEGTVTARPLADR
jgi:hypothetical protein